MVYTEIIFALLILMLLIVMIFGTIPLQNETLNEAIRQEKAQIMAENMFWETVGLQLTFRTVLIISTLILRLKSTVINTW